MATMRLDRFFSSQEILSRKEVKEAVLKKQITVNGETAKKLICRLIRKRLKSAIRDKLSHMNRLCI